MDKLINYLKDRYDITDHIELWDEKSYTQLYIELNDAYVEIKIEYNNNEAGKYIIVHSVDYYIEDGQINATENEKNNIETELNKQLKQYAP